jgi:alanine racemase
MQHTWLEISTQAFFNNLILFQHYTGGKIGVVVKANAYGHGIHEIAQLVSKYSKDIYIFTANCSEALYLRAKGITNPLCVLAYNDSAGEEIVKNDIEIALYEESLVQELEKYAQRSSKKVTVHIKVDTGLSRLGVTVDLVASFITLLQKKYPSCFIKGIFTHLADTNNSDITFTQQQLSLFESVIRQNNCSNIPLIHALASGSVWLHQDYSYNVTRIGTCLYGFWKSDVNKQRLKHSNLQGDLQPVMTWKARIIHLFNKVTTHSIKKYALIPVGYADGYPRCLVDKAVILINKRYAIVREIEMHHLIIDVSEIFDIQKYAEVILMGNYKHIQAEDLAYLSQGLPHEFTTRIAPLIKRLYK